MDIKFKKNSETAKVPMKATIGSAGYDMYADTAHWTTVRPNETIVFTTNIALEIPEGYFGAIYARSGLATRQGLRPSTCVSVIDSDYRGEIEIALHNDSGEIQKIQPYERVAQIIFQKYADANLIEVDELSETDRAAGGFGSTGRG